MRSVKDNMLLGNIRRYVGSFREEPAESAFCPVASYRILSLIITIREPSFLSLNNFRNILSMSAARTIIAMDMGAVLITGGVDLAARRMADLVAVLSASLL